MQNTICIIGVYFGKLPQYFDLWKKSAAYNQSVDFLIITDQHINNLPRNMRTLKMNLMQMKELIEKQLDITEISLQKPYKCCDFRPAFGVVFQEYLHPYLYWGHCDFDMIFGNLQGFFEKYHLFSYDKFLTLGHLSLYRNTTENNIRYKCYGGENDYKTVFLSDIHYAFDEVTGITQIYNHNGFSQFTRRIFCDISSIHYRYRDIEEYTLDEKAQNHNNQVYYWKNGHVYRKWFDRNGAHEDEYIYIHFKKRPDFRLHFDASKINGYYITNRGFFPLENEPNIDSARKYNRCYPIKEIIETLRYKLKPYRMALKK